MYKILIFIPAYNVEKFISKVLKSIPFQKLTKFKIEILAINDNSSDQTLQKLLKLKKNIKHKILIFNNKINQGYGGVQKIAYSYAIKKKFDYVLMLHGDNQYKPKYIPILLNTIIKKKAGGIQGTRMKNIKDAYRGGMPLYKILGNIFLTKFQNIILNLNYNEYHSGYRAYSVNSLEKIFFINNTNYFNFDSEIIMQFKAIKEEVVEIPIKTYYGKEYSNLNSIYYGFKIIYSTLEYFFNKIKYKKYNPKTIESKINIFLKKSFWNDIFKIYIKYYLNSY